MPFRLSNIKNNNKMTKYAYIPLWHRYNYL